MIKIDKNKLYKLIQEMKEYRELLSNVDKIELMKRYKTKVEYLLLDKILKEKGIDVIAKRIQHEKRNLEMVEEITKSERD